MAIQTCMGCGQYVYDDPNLPVDGRTWCNTCLDIERDKVRRIARDYTQGQSSAKDMIEASDRFEQVKKQRK